MGIERGGYFYDQNGFPLANLNGSLASGVLADDHLKATLEQKGCESGRHGPDHRFAVGYIPSVQGMADRCRLDNECQQLQRLPGKGQQHQSRQRHLCSETVAHTMGQPAGPFGKLQLQDRRDRRTPDRQCVQCVQLQLCGGRMDQYRGTRHMGQRLQGVLQLRPHVFNEATYQFLTCNIQSNENQYNSHMQSWPQDVQQRCRLR